jgi:hypothetical protein
MHATKFIRDALETSSGFLLALVNDMSDAPLTFPTPRGGNHPLWVLGHIAVAESQLTNVFIRGGANPLEHWMGIFGARTTPVDNPSMYPALDEVLRAFHAARATTLATLNSMTDADLDQPSPGCPPELIPHLGTIGQVFFAILFHSTIHAGQVTDARRAAGRAPLLFNPPNPAAERPLASVA